MVPAYGRCQRQNAFRTNIPWPNAGHINRFDVSSPSACPSVLRSVTRPELRPLEESSCQLANVWKAVIAAKHQRAISRRRTAACA